jgi:hypothetical protein
MVPRTILRVPAKYLVEFAAAAADRMDQIQILPYFLRAASRVSGRGAVSDMGVAYQTPLRLARLWRYRTCFVPDEAVDIDPGRIND